MELSEKEKKELFWASFLALAAAGFGFVFRVMIPGMWSEEFQITMGQVGALTGAALWPIAITMIIFSLLVDKIGYRISMFCAFFLQAVSVVLTVVAKDVNVMWYACFAAGLGHGIVEACINPLCASMYRKEKSKMLNILHAAWPAGIVFGGIAYLLMVGTGEDLTWGASKWIFWVMLVPILAYGVMFAMVKHYPVDERVAANVPISEMLKEFGGLGTFLASTFLIYEISGQLGLSMGGPNKLYVCLGIGAALGAIAGFVLKSPGKFLFFVLCLIMIPLATAELATDAWINTLMTPIMGAKNAGWAIVFSAGIMMVLRFFAGVPLKVMNPPQLLLLSSVFSIVGLFALSSVNGNLIFGAFVIYAVGQTFYWPTVLGFVSEQFPKGGAITLNTVSAMGLLTVGIFGFPFLGAVQDNYSANAVIEQEPEIVQKVIADKLTFVDNADPDNPTDVAIYQEKNFFGWNYKAINASGLKGLDSMTDEKNAELDSNLAKTSQSSLKVAAVLPMIMAVAFILIIIYYKAIGGYKPVDLFAGHEGDADKAGGSEL
jgi:MFS family permease